MKTTGDVYRLEIQTDSELISQNPLEFSRLFGQRKLIRYGSF